MRRLIFLFVFCILFTSYSVAQHKQYTGSGDDVITIDKPKDGQPALLQVSGNSSERHFSITGYDSQGNRTDLLVNTTERYRGIVPIDLGSNTNTNRLEISAIGSWGINVYSSGAAPSISVPGSKSDSGDKVLWVEGSPSIAELSGNRQGRHFAAYAYNKYGTRLKLLVNTTDPYDGKVIIPSETVIIQVSAVGNWNINLE